MSKVNSIDLISKQQALDADPKVMQYYFTQNLDHAGNGGMLFVLGEVKENILDFWQGTVDYSYFKTILPFVSVINRHIKSCILDVAGFPGLSQITSDNDFSERNRQFEFKRALTIGMLRKF